MQAFFNNPPDTKTPKSSLHEFFQIFGGVPCFTVQQKPDTQPHLPMFICQLKIPQLPPGSDGREAQTVFTAEASTKKLAEQSAAQQALGYIRSRGLPVSPSVSAALPAGNQQQQQQQPPASHNMQGDQMLSTLCSVPQASAPANNADAATSQPVGRVAPADGAAGADTAPPAPRQQPGSIVSPAAAPSSAQTQALPSGDEAAAALEGLEPDAVKQLLIEAQQRVRSLEMQLSKYSDWHRRMRELALEDIVT